MVSFLEEVIDELYNMGVDIDQCIYVLPSKRAGTFLKKIISKKISKTIVSPDIYSIEEFVENISGLSYASQTQQLFQLYKAYLQVGTYEKESFESFLNWGQTLLQDINELDRYLVDTSSLFSGLSAIQEVNHWSLQKDRTTLMENYLHFWKQLNQIYSTFNYNLLENEVGHQGLVYRKASEKITDYVSNTNKSHVFMGFNALNTAESNIIQTILANSNSKLYWDIDEYFLEDKLHDAGLFIRKYKNSWPYLKSNKTQGICNYYSKPKEIEVVGVPKNIAQTKYVGSLLERMALENPKGLKDTAVILGDESLLSPLLHSIPKSIPDINITMGQKVELSGIATFFTSFIDLHLSKTKRGWFYKDFTKFLNNPFSIALLKFCNIDVGPIINNIYHKNWIYLSDKKIQELLDNRSTIISSLFSAYKNPKTYVSKCNTLILTFKDIFEEAEDHLALEQLFKINTLFNQIKDLIDQYEYLTSLKSLKSLYQQLIASETIDFQGDPLEGLQIMGMLESRNLDFETVILTSVNEGILPSGKSNNSFIPFDLKVEYGLPTYKEKDAVYTYHFYRLIQRAKKVFLIYNTEPDVLEGGEKSRLITQILTDENRKDVTERVLAPKIQEIKKIEREVHKTQNLLEMLNAYAIQGFSPSSLSNYIRNPLDFYKRNLMGIEDSDDVEENIAANTMGTIIHDTLEELYTPFQGKEILKDDLKAAKTRITTLVRTNFKKTYLDGAYDSGKNLIAYNVIIKYIQNFVDNEIEQLSHHTIKILGLEKKLQVAVTLPGSNKNIILKGKLDRIDAFDGITRIIDYKTGKVEKRNLEVINWSDIIENYDFSKAFQLLCYSYMFLKTNESENIHAGIISIKNLKEGVMLFCKKTSVRDTKKNPIIDRAVLQEFEQLLFSLIEEILDPKIPFIEKEV